MRAVAVAVAVLASGVASADTFVQGQLTGSTTWTRAGSPYRMTGDVLVPMSVSLEIEPGVEVIAESSDAQNLGQYDDKVELIGDGTLYVRGTDERPITFRGATASTSPSTPTWYGVRMRKGGVFNHVVIRDAMQGLSAGLRSNVEVSYSVFTGNGDGVYVEFGSLTMHHTLLHANGRGFVNYAGNSSGTAQLDHVTVEGNNTGVWTTNHGRTQFALRNSIVVNNGTGLYADNFSGRSALSHNDFWNNATHYEGDAPDSASFSLDPLFVSATDFHLRATSPCRAAASNGTDLGAHASAVSDVARVELTPNPVTVGTLSTTAFTARAYDSAGNHLSGAHFTWSAKAQAGTINAQGLLSAQCSLGTVSSAVTATSRNGLSASAEVSIVPGEPARVDLTPKPADIQAGASVAFKAQVYDGCAHALPDAVTWSTASGAGTITSAGVYTAPCATGTYPDAIIARAGSVTGSASATITEGPLAQLSLSPLSLSVPAGGQHIFTATAADSCGNSLSPSLTWSVRNGGGRIDSEGVFTAGTRAGVYTDTVRAVANAEGLSASTSVVVKPGPVARVTLTPDAPEVLSGGSLQFTARAEDSFGNEVLSPAPLWSASAEAGHITDTGLFTAGSTPGLHTDAVAVQVGDVKTATAVRIPEPIPTPAPTTHGCSSTGGASASLWALLLAAVALRRRVA